MTGVTATRDVSHVVPCGWTLDRYNRCLQCLVANSRSPYDPWLPGDDRFVPGLLRPKEMQ